MKPTSPEDHELEKMSSQVSERYRAGAADEPSARLDAAILAAARRELAQPRPRRNWQRPASIAAMLVIGVSLILLVRDNEPPLPSLDRHAADEAKLARPASPQLAMKTQPEAGGNRPGEGRPSRERSTRPDRAPVVRDEMAAMQENAASGESAQPAASPASPAVAGMAEPAEKERSRIEESAGVSASKKSKALADAATESRAGARALRKDDVAPGPAPPQDWLGRIDALLREGKDAEAKEQLLRFRKQFPDYPLSQRLQALLPPDQR